MTRKGFGSFLFSFLLFHHGPKTKWFQLLVVTITSWFQRLGLKAAAHCLVSLVLPSRQYTLYVISKLWMMVTHSVPLFLTCSNSVPCNTKDEKQTQMISLFLWWSVFWSHKSNKCNVERCCLLSLKHALLEYGNLQKKKSTA